MSHDNTLFKLSDWDKIIIYLYNVAKQYSSLCTYSRTVIELFGDHSSFNLLDYN